MLGALCYIEYESVDITTSSEEDDSDLESADEPGEEEYGDDPNDPSWQPYEDPPLEIDDWSGISDKM